jgi:tRNA(Ile)-lysidine synthase
LAGLAISGGVDSMALATLCSMLLHDKSRATKLRFKAFVVDHGVREGSNEEATAVSIELEARG